MNPQLALQRAEARGRKLQAKEDRARARSRQRVHDRLVKAHQIMSEISYELHEIYIARGSRILDLENEMHIAMATDRAGLALQSMRAEYPSITFNGSGIGRTKT